MNAADFACCLQDLRVDEGLRLRPYRDTLGVLTIGYGINLDRGISRAEAEMLLEHRAVERLGELSHAIPWFATLDPVRQRVLLNMSYQLGVAGLLKFRRTLESIRLGEYDDAAQEMLQSRWAQQTPNRVQRLARWMQTGRAD